MTQTETLSLRTDQIADLAFYMANQRCLNLSEAGTGKTPSVVVMQYWLWSQHQIGTAWLQPKSLMKKNKREILRFTDFTDEDVVIVDGTKKQIEKALASKAKVFIMGFRRFAISWRQLPNYVKAYHVDELHMGFKSSTSQQSQELHRALLRPNTWFLGMTGTLIDGKLTSAYPAIRAIEPRYYLSEADFERQHAIKGYDGKVIGWHNHERISAILGRHAIRRTFASVHGDQEVVTIPEVVDMKPEQRKMFDTFEQEAILELEQFFLDGTVPGVAFTRAIQLQEHPHLFPDLTSPGKFINIMKDKYTEKEERLLVHLEEHDFNGKPLIIFTPRIPQQERVAELLTKVGLSFATINGNLSQKQKDQASDDFEAGRVQVMLGTPETAAVGYNWQFSGGKEVDHLIFMSLGYGDAEYIQARQRPIRGKRSSPLRVTILEYADSLDQHLCSIIYRKSVEANKVDPTRPVLQLSGYEKNYKL